MIELGKMQKLEVIRNTQIGVFLNSIEDKEEYDILLPKKQIPENVEVGDIIEVFVYKDSEDRIISTTTRPKIVIDELAVLEVVEVSKIGIFLDWGLEKDLFLPYTETNRKLENGQKHLVALYIDGSNRLCATMNLYSFLDNKSPYNEKDRVTGTIYSINSEFGAFVAIDNKYQGLIPNKELYGNYSEGDSVDVRIKKIRKDGKCELSLRKEFYNEIDGDANLILEKIELNGGSIQLNDKSSPEMIKKEFNISKSAFKRAVGSLFKSRKIKITDNGIEVIKKEKK